MKAIADSENVTQRYVARLKSCELPPANGIGSPGRRLLGGEGGITRPLRDLAPAGPPALRVDVLRRLRRLVDISVGNRNNLAQRARRARAGTRSRFAASSCPWRDPPSDSNPLAGPHVVSATSRERMNTHGSATVGLHDEVTRCHQSLARTVSLA